MNQLAVSWATTDDLFLRRLYLFAPFGTQQLQQLMDSARLIRLEAGEYLFQQGQPAPRFFALRSGQMKLFRLSRRGDEKVFDVVGPGQTFCEEIMCTEQPVYPTTAQALRDCEVYSFSFETFETLLRGSPDACLHFMTDLGERISRLIKELDEVTLQDATTRLVSFLLEHGAARGDADVVLDVPKGIIASRLSIRPETLSRILHRLRDKGLVEVKRSSIHVNDVAGLKAVLLRS
jgi:CRP-like cAMP-binding protein